MTTRVTCIEFARADREVEFLRRIDKNGLDGYERKAIAEALALYCIDSSGVDHVYEGDPLGPCDVPVIAYKLGIAREFSEEFDASVARRRDERRESARCDADLARTVRAAVRSSGRGDADPE